MKKKLWKCVWEDYVKRCMCVEMCVNKVCEKNMCGTVGEMWEYEVCKNMTG